ncbi:DUF498 domain protein [Paecilomyces variotii]|uniref:NADH dehydrogenase [ubiquinone] 1 alpha subcomplex assembly factor 3 n=1 Tax=Byssochlamys spectabilis TaxID=264951 RepID=A0A443I337_BYSSP|nr:DUF498 domain protein [Paecilomyces variotii]KAJ9260124.1 hypothetical protein DTO207G8_821 [Paecilomyces variotii]KAJ9350564.1 hypothetical protein DTO280E4_8644 [Paecilomyces variotii]RWQ98494.1 DUF498 domain protein [Paecilomyces variotii]
MQPPSPQLLRALRASISTGAAATCSRTASHAALRTSIASPVNPAYRSLGASIPRRYNSNTARRPSRIVPRAQPAKPQNRDRGPPSNEETQTDFGALNVFGNIPAPSTAIDACLDDGFHLDNGVKITGGDGVLLVGGEAFSWRPWEGYDKGDDKKGLMLNAKGQFEVPEEAWGLLSLVWPRPDLLILGVGGQMAPLSPETRKHINLLGIRVEVQDTRNAAAQFNLLATERGVTEVAAAMIPIGWRSR